MFLFNILLSVSCFSAGDGAYIWDYCAASVILSEAGGFLVEIDGKPFNLNSREVVVSCTKQLGLEIVDVIQRNLRT